MTPRRARRDRNVVTSLPLTSMGSEQDALRGLTRYDPALSDFVDAWKEIETGGARAAVIIATEYVEDALEGIFRQCEPSGGFICRSVESMLWRIGEVNVEQEDCNALCPGDKTRLALRHTGVLHFGTCGHRRRCPGRSTDRQGSDAAPRGGDRPHDAALL